MAGAEVAHKEAKRLWQAHCDSLVAEMALTKSALPPAPAVMPQSETAARIGQAVANKEALAADAGDMPPSLAAILEVSGANY